jgi:hypothetical protein
MLPRNCESRVPVIDQRDKCGKAQNNFPVGQRRNIIEQRLVPLLKILCTACPERPRMKLVDGVGDSRDIRPPGVIVEYAFLRNDAIRRYAEARKGADRANKSVHTPY